MVAERVGDAAADDAPAIHANRRRAALLCVLPAFVAGLVVGIVLAAIGLLLEGLCVFAAIAAGGALLSWWRAPGAVVRGFRAEKSDEEEHPRVHNLVEGLCATMGLPPPQIWLVDSPVPNAMAIGRDPRSASLVVTTGLDRTLSLVELEGVLAHELVHVKRHDTVVAALAVAVALPWALVRGQDAGAQLVHRLLGPGREFTADQRAASVVRYPPGIASALEAMVLAGSDGAPWPPVPGRMAAISRWLWIDPVVGGPVESPQGNLDDTRVRAAALSLR